MVCDIQGSDITLGCLWRLRMSAHGCKLEVASLFEVRGCVVNFNIHEIYIKVDFRLRAAAGKRTPELRLHARRPQRAKRGPAWHSRKIPCTALAALAALAAPAAPAAPAALVSMLVVLWAVPAVWYGHWHQNQSTRSAPVRILPQYNQKKKHILTYTLIYLHVHTHTYTHTVRLSFCVLLLLLLFISISRVYYRRHIIMSLH